MKKLLAVVGAVALVVGAVFLRRALDGDEGADGVEEMLVICGPDVAPACEALTAEDDGIRVEIRPEATTAGEVTTGDVALDGSTAWLTAAPWPAMGAAAAQSTGDDFPDLAGSAVLAESPAVMVARTDRMEAITEACGTPTWACIGGVAGGSWTDLGGEAAWGRVEVALPPATDGAGAVAVNQAVASQVGRTDFAVNDLDEDPATGAWFERLASQSSSNQRSGLSPLQQFLRVPGSLGVVGALAAEADTEIARASTGSTLSAVVPEPRSTAVVRLWAADGDSLAAVAERVDLSRLEQLLADAGWSVPGGGGDDGGTMVSEDQGPYPEEGLPRAGVMSAVVTRWENVR